MSLVLYRKYRPQKFSQVIGQNFVIKVLQGEIKLGRVAHAYLFTGPRGLGKTTVARIFAKAVNCPNLDIKKEIEPCNKCLICKEITAGSSLNLVEIDGASNRGIDEIRALKEKVRFPPPTGKKKVFVIDEVHMLTTEAFNALLKTLEEPPEFAIFILATTEPHRLPETIISRCQRFDFKKVGAKEIIKRLKMIVRQEKREVDDKVLENIAYHSEGCVRDAESLLGQVLSLADGKITLEQASLVFPPQNLDLLIDFARLILEKKTSLAIEKINSIMEEGIDLERFREDFLEFLRKALLLRQGVSFDNFNWSDLEMKKVKELVGSVETEQLINVIEEFLKIPSFSRYSPIPQLPFEIAILNLSHNVHEV